MEFENNKRNVKYVVRYLQWKLGRKLQESCKLSVILRILRYLLIIRCYNTCLFWKFIAIFNFTIQVSIFLEYSIPPLPYEFYSDTRKIFYNYKIIKSFKLRIQLF